MTSYDDVESLEKYFINWNIISLLMAKDFQNGRDNGGKIIVLDSLNFRTSTALVERGFASMRIYIIEHDPLAFSIMCNSVKSSHALQDINIIRGDLFEYLASCRTSIFAIVADLMTAMIPKNGLDTLGFICKRCSVRRCFITLTMRCTMGFTIKDRIAILQRSLFGRVMPGFHLAWGYKRNGVGTAMMQLGFRNTPCEKVAWRPHTFYVSEKNNLIVEKWWGLSSEAVEENVEICESKIKKRRVT